MSKPVKRDKPARQEFCPVCGQPMRWFGRLADGRWKCTMIKVHDQAAYTNRGAE